MTGHLRRFAAACLSALACAAGMIAPKLRIPAYAFAVMLGVSRVMVGAHFLSDVLAGAAFGIATCVILKAMLEQRGWRLGLRPQM